MVGKRSKEIVSYNMSRIRSEGSKIEGEVECILKSIPYEYARHPTIYGKPDFAYPEFKIAIFADSDFWHGYEWEKKKKELKTNIDFWIKKIERNMARDVEVTSRLREEGWEVIRLWGHDIINSPEECKTMIEKALKEKTAC